MGTWAAGSFENDSALDWLNKLYDNPQAELVLSTLQLVVRTTKEERDSHIEMQAVAAADVVACWLGMAPPETRRAGLVKWTQKHLILSPEIIATAQQAVHLIKTQSNLLELWGSRAKWLDAMANLQERLQQSPKE